MLLVAISHGKVSKTLSGRRNAEDNGNTFNLANLGKKNSTTEENHLFKDVGKHPNLNDSGEAARLLERLTFTPSSFLLSESPGVEPEATAQAWPEPGPDWSKAFGEWGAAWEFHVYLFAMIFLGFALYATYFIGHGLYVGLNQKYLGFCLNVVMLILGFTRAFVLLTDPYHQGDIIHNVLVMRVLWSLASPCLTSADCLVILALVETAKISLAPQKMQKLSFVLTIIMVHFILVLVSDFVVSEFVEAKAMLVFCQGFFTMWGAILGVGYFVLGYKLDQKLFGHKEIKSRNDVLYIRLIFASGVNNLVLCTMFIYASASVFGVYSDVKFVDAWSWWIVQTCFRVSEVSSGILVFTVSAKRKSLKKKPDKKAKGEYQVDQLNISASDANKVGTATGRKNERKLSLFSQLYPKKAPAGIQGKSVVLVTTTVQQRNCSTTGRKQERKLRLFSQLHSKEAPAGNQGKSDVLATATVQEGNCSTTGRKQERKLRKFSQLYSKEAPAGSQGKHEVLATATEQKGNCPTTGRKQDKKLSQFSQLDSKKAPAKNQVLPTTPVDGGDHNMLTDLHEAKIEAYHAHV